MKTTFLIAASMLIGTAAIAQTTNPDASASQPTTASDPAAAPAAAPDMAPAPAPMAAPADAAPAPMAAPAEAAPAAAPTDTSNYPRCSRTVHDKCVQKGGR